MARRFLPLHCWADYRSWLSEMGREGSDEWLATLDNNRTCMLEPLHRGPHEWTKDDEIAIKFPQKEEGPAEAEPSRKMC